MQAARQALKSANRAALQKAQWRNMSKFGLHFRHPKTKCSFTDCRRPRNIPSKYLHRNRNAVFLVDAFFLEGMLCCSPQNDTSTQQLYAFTCAASSHRLIPAGSNASVEESLAEMEKWKKITYAAIPVCLAYAVYCLSGE